MPLFCALGQYPPYWLATGDTGNGEKVKLYVADKITDQTGINSWLQQRQDAFDEQFGDRIEVTHLPAPAGSSDEIQAVMLQFTDAVDAPALAQVNLSLIHI